MTRGQRAVQALLRSGQSGLFYGASFSKLRRVVERSLGRRCRCVDLRDSTPEDDPAALRARLREVSSASDPCFVLVGAPSHPLHTVLHELAHGQLGSPARVAAQPVRLPQVFVVQTSRSPSPELERLFGLKLHLDRLFVQGARDAN